MTEAKPEPSEPAREGPVGPSRFHFAAGIAKLILCPSNALVVLAGLGIVAQVVSPDRRVGLDVSIISLISLVVLGVVPVGDLMLRRLQMRFPRFSSDGSPVTGIIVLGGIVSAYRTVDAVRWAPTGAVGRLFETARLAADFPSARVLVSAGPELLEGAISEADGIADCLMTMGVNLDRMLLEHRSRDTFENAQFSHAAVRPEPGERWLLVTSAYHMPRAMGCFRKVGFNVVAAPADRPTRSRAGGWSASRNLTRCDLATKEYIGLAVYWLMGKTSAFMAAP